MKRALVVGIDHYKANPLMSCEQDAAEIARLLGRNEETINPEANSKNFDVRTLFGADGVTRQDLLTAVKLLFAGPAEVVVFYFAGHASVDPETTFGHLITPDCEADGFGVSMSEIAALAAQAWPAVKATVILLDCCRAGRMGAAPGASETLLGKGVTILAACDEHEDAGSDLRHGVFTEIMIDALKGGAADIRGFVTPSSIYTHVDQSLGWWDAQRPIYKANVREFTPLRRVAPKVSDETLRLLPKWFEEATSEFALDPSFESDIPAGTEDAYPAAVRARNQAIFRQLQKLNRCALLEPVGEDHMYYAAMNAKSCRLTLLGRHYHMLAQKDRM